MFLAQWLSRSLALRGCRCAPNKRLGPQCCLLTLPNCNGRQTNSFLKLRSNPASRQRTYRTDVGDTASRDYLRWQGSDTSGRPYRYRKLHLSNSQLRIPLLDARVFPMQLPGSVPEKSKVVALTASKRSATSPIFLSLPSERKLETDP